MLLLTVGLGKVYLISKWGNHLRWRQCGNGTATVTMVGFSQSSTTNSSTCRQLPEGMAPESTTNHAKRSFFRVVSDVLVATSDQNVKF